MTDKSPNDSVQDEQFAAREEADEVTGKKENEEKVENRAEPPVEPAESTQPSEELEGKKPTRAKQRTRKPAEPADDKSKESGSGSEAEAPAAPETEEPAAPETETPAAPETEAPAAPETETPAAPETETPAAPETEAPAAPETETPSAPETEAPAAPEPEEEDVSGTDKKTGESRNLDDVELPPVDYSGYPKNELVDTLALIIDNRPPSEIRDDVERIKIHFYKKLKHESDERKSKFLEEGGKIEDYKIYVDPLEHIVKELIEKYKAKKTDYTKIQEAEKIENLKRKYDIIDKIKDLVNREESINKTFQEFRNLQNEWHSTGVVPQSSLKDLWENYHHNVEIFYDYIKINKELRDLDLKKNLELKVKLCEKAEELLLEPSAINAFRTLQEYHDQWREIGPVPSESKNEIWERFREATSKINKRHHEYFEKQKDDQRKNLEAKIALCEKVEEINLLDISSFKEFDEKADIVVGLQKMWRTIGFAPKKQNNKVYQRFREACDAFFEKKRAFYADNKEIQQNNLQRKIELCIQAESLQESTDWKATSDALINLQKEWKEVGPVPRKQAEKVWKRFRKACDHFFNRKAGFFAELDTSYEDNLKAKEAIIDELEKFEPGSDVQQAFERLKDIQKRWTDIGFVPFNMKETITNKYRDALNKQFDRLKIGEEDKSILKYRTKLDNLKTNPKASRKIRNERDKFLTKIKQLENDIVLWENNIGFFAKSPNAETMIREVEDKIENARKMIKMLEEKVKMIDLSGLDE